MSGELNTIENVTSIGQYAFYKCSSITGTLTIPVGLTTISNNVFNGIGISKLIIPNSVTGLNNNTFSNCSNLTDLTVPISLNTVKSSATSASFSGCTGITKVKFTKGNGNENGEGFNYSLNTNRFTIFIYSLESFTG